MSKRSAATAGLVILVVIGVLSVYSTLMFPPQISPADQGTDYAYGYYFGRALFPLLGLAAFIRLVTRKRTPDEGLTGRRYVTVGPVGAHPVTPGSEAPAASLPHGAEQHR